MRILVVSDIHRRKSNLERVIEKHPDIDDIIFLGDGIYDAEEISGFYPKKTFNLISGNCDFLSKYPSTKIFVLHGVKIIATHGHSYGVKMGTDHLLSTAKTQGAIIALYGHTHIQKLEYRDGVYLICPGALGNSQDGPGYAILEITPKGIITNLLKI